MDTLTLLLTICSFVLSFIFAMGGIGSALVLIPTVTWMGIPFAQARSLGLFVNALSMTGATISNIKNKRLDYRLGVPIIIASVLCAPLGAWAGLRLPTQIVLMAFIAFLSFSGLMMLFFKSSTYKDQYREDRPVIGPLMVGILAGLLSGLLGVGGGGVISPLMIMQGFNPKKVAAITAFAVPFSSMTAFVAYMAMGAVAWNVLLFAGLAAWLGGYLGTTFMQKRLDPQTVKKFLASVILLLALRLIVTHI